ncbi:MAG: DUF3306 domain-containing protein [Thiotrichales bacterium]|nr:MAG: DUF3306 domain-containing protein [Thiotrichales bacterium]
MSQSKTSRYSREGQAEPDFISRWSRLKHEAGQTPEETGDRQGISSDAADSPDRNHQDQVLTDADMPDIDSLTFDSVFSDFMSPGVSEKLRKQALRKLFHSEVFNLRDGLDEYDGDYTQFEKLGDIVTSDMHHQVEMEARRRAEQLLQDETPAGAASLEDIDRAQQEPVEHQADSVAALTGNDDNDVPYHAEGADVAADVDAYERKESIPGGSTRDE